MGRKKDFIEDSGQAFEMRSISNLVWFSFFFLIFLFFLFFFYYFFFMEKIFILLIGEK